MSDFEAKLCSFPSEGSGVWCEWEDLLRRVPDGMKLFGPGWYAIWSATVGSTGRWTGRISVILVRDRRGTLQGILPLAWGRVGLFRIPAFCGYVQPWRDILAAKGWEEDVGVAMAKCLRKSGTLFAHIGPSQRSSPTFRGLLQSLRDHGAGLVPRRTEALAIADLPASWDEYRQCVVGSKFFRKVGYYERRMERAGHVERTHYRCPTETDTERVVQDMSRIESRSWLMQAPGGRPRFQSSADQQFWKLLIQDVLAPRDQFDCWILSLQDEPVSFCLTLTADTVRYAIANSYDQAVRDHRTGSTLYRYMMEDAIARGVRHVDFGTGELHYKKYWGATYQDAVDTYAVATNRMVGRLLRLGCALPTWRRVGSVPQTLTEHPAESLGAE